MSLYSIIKNYSGKAATAITLAATIGCHSYTPPRDELMPSAKVVLEASYSSIYEKTNPGYDTGKFDQLKTSLTSGISDEGIEDKAMKLLELAESAAKVNADNNKAMNALLSGIKDNKTEALNDEALNNYKNNLKESLQSFKCDNYSVAFEVENHSGKKREQARAIAGEYRIQLRTLQQYLQFFADVCFSDGYVEQAAQFDEATDMLQEQLTGCNYTDAARVAFNEKAGFKEEFEKAMAEIKEIQVGEPSEYYKIMQIRYDYMQKVYKQFSGTDGKRTINHETLRGLEILLDGEIIKTLAGREDYNRTLAIIRQAVPVSGLEYTFENDVIGGHLFCEKTAIEDSLCHTMEKVRNARMGATDYGWHVGSSRDRDHLLHFVIQTGSHAATAISLALSTGGNGKSNSGSTPTGTGFGGGQIGGDLIGGGGPGNGSIGGGQ